MLHPIRLPLLVVALAPLFGPPTDPWQNLSNVYGPPSIGDDIHLPGAGAQAVSGSLEDFDVGELTGSLDLDGVLQAGGKVHFLYAVGGFGYCSLVASSVASSAIQGGGATTGTDAILVSSSAGLERYEFDPDANAMVGPTTLRATPPWQNIPLLECLELTGDGREEVVMTPPGSPTAVRVCDVSPSGTAILASFSVSGDVLEFDAMDWNDDGSEDLVLRCDDALRIFDLSVSPAVELESWTWGDSDGAICTIPETAVHADDYLAWARRNATSSDFELLVLHRSDTNPTPVPLAYLLDQYASQPTPLEITDLQAGDCDGDGDLDLLAGQTSLNAVVALGNQGVSRPAYSCGPTGAACITLGPSVLTGGDELYAPFAFRDVNQDGRADALVPDADASLGNKIDYVPDMPDFPSGGPIFVMGDDLGLSDDQFETYQGPYYGQLYVPPAFLSYTHLQVVVWEQGSATSSIDADAVANEFLALPDPTGQQTPSIMNMTLSWPVAATTSWPSGLTYYFSMRMVDAPNVSQGNFTVESATEWQFYGFTLDTGPGYADHLLYHPNYLSNEDLIAYEPFGASGVIGIVANIGGLSGFAGTPAPGDPENTGGALEY